MNKKTVFCLLMLAVCFVLCACQPQGKEMSSAALTGLYYSESSSYVKPVLSYSFEATQEGGAVSFALAHREEAYTVQVDGDFAAALKEILVRYQAQRWDGFDKSRSGLQDGVQFTFRCSFADGTDISARGYGARPDTCGDAMKEIDALVMKLLPEDTAAL